MRYLTTLTLGILLAAGVVAGKTQNELKQLRWLLGTWEHRTSRGILYENWSQLSETEFRGKSFSLRNQDTLTHETIQLIQNDQGTFYIPTVKGQNNNLPVRFTLKSSSDPACTFENPAHDFPQRIAYTRINADSLVAEISGLRNGREQRQVFSFKRVK